MDNNKISTFMGFVMRTKRYRIGVNAVATLKKAELMVVCKTASENTKKDADKLARRLHVPLLETVEQTLEAYVHHENAKVMAITDKGLAKAILENRENHFIARNLGDKNG